MGRVSVERGISWLEERILVEWMKLVGNLSKELRSKTARYSLSLEYGILWFDFLIVRRRGCRSDRIPPHLRNSLCHLRAPGWPGNSLGERVHERARSVRPASSVSSEPGRHPHFPHKVYITSLYDKSSIVRKEQACRCDGNRGNGVSFTLPFSFAVLSKWVMAYTDVPPCHSVSCLDLNPTQQCVLLSTSHEIVICFPAWIEAMLGACYVKCSGTRLLR